MNLGVSVHIWKNRIARLCRQQPPSRPPALWLLIGYLISQLPHYWASRWGTMLHWQKINKSVFVFLSLGWCFLQEFLCLTVGFLYSIVALKPPAHLQTWSLCASPRGTQVKYSEYTSGRVLLPPCCEDIAVPLFSSIAAPRGESLLHIKHAWIADPVSVDNDILAFGCTHKLDEAPEILSLGHF